MDSGPGQALLSHGITTLQLSTEAVLISHKFVAHLHMRERCLLMHTNADGHYSTHPSEAGGICVWKSTVYAHRYTTVFCQLSNA